MGSGSVLYFLHLYVSSAVFLTSPSSVSLLHHLPSFWCAVSNEPPSVSEELAAVRLFSLCSQKSLLLRDEASCGV